MQLKIISKRTLIIAILVGLAIFLVVFSYFITKKPIQNSSIVSTEDFVALQRQRQVDSGSSVLAVGKPVRLKIPVINVDASIEYVGLTPQGLVGVPEDNTNAAWFDIGARPGDNGSAVVTGHYGLRKGKASVFDDLYKLRKGDKIYIEDDKGSIVSFVVRESRRYDADEKASEVFYSSDGKSHLNLITCEGDWDNTSKTYSQRLVVFADKE